MNRILQFMIFFAIFLSVYFGMNAYVYFRLSRIITHPALWIVISTLVLSLPIISILERFFDGPIVTVFYFISMAWLGTLFFLLITFLLIDVAGLFFKFDYARTGLIAIGLVFVLIIYSIITAQTLTIKRIDVPMKNLKEDVRIVQLSDIHVGTVHKHGFLKHLVQTTNAQNPDIVVITGDLFDGSGPIGETSISPLKELKAKTYFVTGNHENYLGKELAIDIVKKNNITVLQKSFVKIKNIQLIGIDNPMRDIDNSTDKLDGMNLSKNMPRILLYHLPILQSGADLQLSGHTHNGQIYPFTLLVKILFKNTYGLYKHEDSYIYVSSGVGSWGPPMRFLAPSEIVVITLKKTI